jgi:hypothetical protein
MNTTDVAQLHAIVEDPAIQLTLEQRNLIYKAANELGSLAVPPKAAAPTSELDALRLPNGGMMTGG